MARESFRDAVSVANGQVDADVRFGNSTILSIFFGAGMPAGTYQITAAEAKLYTSTDAELQIVLSSPGPRTIICDGNLSGLGTLPGAKIVFPSAATESTRIVVHGS